MSYEVELQTGLYNLLANDAPLNVVVTGVFDAVPQDYQAFPYVTIGEDTFIEWDTDTNTGAEATVTLHTWSRYNGKKETKEIQGLVYDAVHRQESAITVTGFKVVNMLIESSNSVLDPGGLTRHGIQLARVQLRKL